MQKQVDYRIRSDFELRLPEEQIWRLAGVRRGSGEVRESLRVAGREAIERARPRLRPRAMWGAVALAGLGPDGVRLEGGQSFSSPALAKLLRGAERIAVALVTVGGELEAAVHELLEQGDYLEAMLLDAVGSVAVGEVADRLCEQIAQEVATQGQEIGPSLSAGSRYWPLEDQRVVFDLLPGAEIGVTLNPSYLMLPEKSETFVVGVGKDLKFKDRPGAPCRFCGRADCAYREREMVVPRVGHE